MLARIRLALTKWWWIFTTSTLPPEPEPCPA